MSQSSPRRDFFASLAAFASAALAASTTSRNAFAQSSSPSERIQKAYSLRMDMADYYKAMGDFSHPTNGDEERYPNRINSFSKTLLHDPLGHVSRDAYNSMQRAVLSNKPEDYEAIFRGGNVRLKNPSAAYTMQLMGADSSQFSMRAAPAFDSPEQAGEMVELYWQALTRDIPFASYDSDPLINSACQELSRMPDFRGPKQAGRVTPNTVFRGNTGGDLAGPYLSQFLALPVELGANLLDTRLRPATPGLEFMTSYSDWLGIQLGEGKGPGNRYEETRRYISTGRDLATYVHFDYSFSPYYQAAWHLLHAGSPALSGDNPYLYTKGQDAFVTFGPPDALEYTSRAARTAFHAAWYQKWLVHKRARPEVFAGRIHNHKIKAAVYPISDEVLDSSGLDQSFRKWGTYLLAQAYSEGSPAHSAYPAGHATVAGACVTMLKAFFNENYVIENPMVPSADGTRLLPYRGTDLTVGNELNKMATNIAMGRDFAGIHWRTDGSEGLKLGEAVAIQMLKDITSQYQDGFGGFNFTRFDGTKMTVCPSCI